jgi:hypothetical protein
VDLHQKPPFHPDISRLCQLILAFASSPTKLAVKAVNLGDCVQVAKLAKPKLFKTGASGTCSFSKWIGAGFFKHSMGARNRMVKGSSHRPARLHRLEELIPWNRFLGSLTVNNSGYDAADRQSAGHVVSTKNVSYIDCQPSTLYI